MKSLPQLKNKAQDLFNEFVRLRDSTCSNYFRLRDSTCSNYFKCISCSKFKSIKYMHAGHFYNVGHYDGLRFNEDNCHGQCNHCNTFLHGNLIDYGFNLMIKIGPERYEKLRIKAGLYKRNGYKFSRFELEILIKEYSLKIRELKEND